MTSSHPSGVRPLTNQQILGFTGIVGVWVIVVQVLTATMDNNTIGVWSASALAGLAIFLAAYLFTHAVALRQRAFSRLSLHMVTYLLVNGSYWIHAWVLLATGQDDLLSEGWAGPLFAMPILWGAGLLFQTLGSLLSGGYDGVEL